MPASSPFDLGLTSVAFIRVTQWFLTFRCGCVVNATLGYKADHQSYFDSRVRCSAHAHTLPFMGPTYRPTADDYRPCESCGQLCAPFPHRESELCSGCWWDEERLAEEMRA